MSRRLLVLALLVWFTGPIWADSRPDSGFPQADGPVEAVLVTDRRILIAGGFRQLVDGGGTWPRNGLAAIDPATGLVDSAWLPTLASDTITSIQSLALSPDGGTLYVGGDFTRIGGSPRRNLAAIDMQKGRVTGWDPGADGPVGALAVSTDGEVVYAGGGFAHVDGQPRRNLAAIDATAGRVIPWRVDADGVVEDLVLSNPDGVLYAVGAFTLIGGQLHAHLAAIDIAAAAARPDWQADTDAPVHVITRSRDGSTLYIGGDFSQVATLSRAHLAALKATDGSVEPWAPDTDGPVRALALSADEQALYVGGAFTQVLGQARSDLAGLTVAAGQPLAWAPSATGTGDVVTRIASMAVGPSGHWLYVGGVFGQLGGRSVGDVARFVVAPPVTHAVPPPGAYTSPQSVILSCTDNRGQPCTEIRYTLDGSSPTATSPLYAGPIALAAPRTPLRFAGLGGEGLREVATGGDYFIDTLAPVTDNDLPAGSYGAGTLHAVTLGCRDESNGSGCAATYFTLDGSAPRADPQNLYRRPFDLTNELDRLGLTAGEVRLRYFSVDRAGNREAGHSDLYKLDQAPPVITADPPQGNYSRPLRITLSCRDDSGDPCGPLFYTLDGRQPSDGRVRGANGQPLPATLRYEGEIVLDKGATLEVMARDSADNIQTGLIGIYALTDPVSRGGKGTGGLGWLSLLGLGLLGRARWRRGGPFSDGSAACP